MLRLRLPAGRLAQHPAVEDINSHRLKPAYRPGRPGAIEAFRKWQWQMESSVGAALW